MNRKYLIAALCLAFGSASMARAAEVCGAPATIPDRAGATGARVTDYRPVFKACRIGKGPMQLAIRSFRVDSRDLLLMVDPEKLATEISAAACWTCADTTDEAQKGVRFARAIREAGGQAVTTRAVSRNAGLVHGQGEGSFVTADLCPSHRPFDRAFLDLMAQQGPHTPIALSISGGWLARHGADFDWLREKARAGALDITWVDHTYSHPYVPGLADARNFMMLPGTDLDREIEETERLLIARGGTPSVFFRFPGLVADRALMEKLARRHLIALGADAWLVLSPPPRPGSIVLVHANGNEEAGLRLFARLLTRRKIPKPFRPIEDAP